MIMKVERDELVEGTSEGYIKTEHGNRSKRKEHSDWITAPRRLESPVSDRLRITAQGVEIIRGLRRTN